MMRDLEIKADRAAAKLGGFHVEIISASGTTYGLRDTDRDRLYLESARVVVFVGGTIVSFSIADAFRGARGGNNPDVRFLLLEQHSGPVRKRPDPESSWRWRDELPRSLRFVDPGR